MKNSTNEEAPRPKKKKKARAAGEVAEPLHRCRSERVVLADVAVLRQHGGAHVHRGRLAPGQRQLVDQVIDFMNPAEARFAGVELDNRAAMPDARIAGIRVPTLVVHATDDTLQLYRNAAFAASTIPNARLLRFERGGHLLIAVEQPRVRAEVQAFIRAHAGPGG